MLENSLSKRGQPPKARVERTGAVGRFERFGYRELIRAAAQERGLLLPPVEDNGGTHINHVYTDL